VQRHRRSRLSNSHHERSRSSEQNLLHPKKVGTLPISDQEVKRTNEIKTAIPLLDAIDIQGKNITGDALLNQRKIADDVVRQRQAHYHFTVKNNQPGLFQDIALYFEDRQQPDFVLCDPPDHGRIEIRKIWTTTELNDYLNFPHVGQAFVIQRESTDKKTGEYSCDIAYGFPAELLNKPTLSACLPPTAAIGASKTAVITLSIGTITKTAAGYEPAMARIISRACDALPLASSNPKVYAVSRRKCDS
jgi:predicted transposase YbfD/YdcC